MVTTAVVSQNIESKTEEKLEEAQVVAVSVSSAGVRIGGDDAGEDKVRGETQKKSV